MSKTRKKDCARIMNIDTDFQLCIDPVFFTITVVRTHDTINVAKAIAAFNDDAIHSVLSKPNKCENDINLHY